MNFEAKLNGCLWLAKIQSIVFCANVKCPSLKKLSADKNKQVIRTKQESVCKKAQYILLKYL